MTEVCNSQILTAQGQEVLTLCDDYGTVFLLQIPVTDSANRQARIDAALAQQNTNQTALETYAAAHSIDLSAQKAAGTAKKTAMKGLPHA